MKTEHESDEHQQMMGQRGVTRMHHQMQGEMSRDAREQMHHRHHQQTIWIYVTVILLGVWLVAAPVTLGYLNTGTVAESVARVTEVRNLAPVADRAAALAWSDIVSGLLLVVFGVLSLNPRWLLAPWAASVVGMWLLFAPLVLWSPSPAAYANDSIVGILVIALTVLIPGMPGMLLIMKMGPAVPPSWTYNPSSWPQRAPVIALGWIGFFLSRYLAAYQLGYIPTAWDPLFGSGTMTILDSEVSKAWPISDAGLGATAYTIEALMGFMGGTARWRTMPWMVLFFGILVVPLGLVSIALVILQPVAVGTWCTICLVTALAMLVMIPLTLDEVVAMFQFLVQKVRGGSSLWRTFWLGDTVEGGGDDERSPRLNAPPTETAPAMVWGVTVPWTLLAASLLGVWIMFAPKTFGTLGTPFGDSDALVGALITVVAVIAMAEVVRAGRYLNVLAGLWLVAAPWLLVGATTPAAVNDVVLGIVIVLLSLPRGSVRERYGGWSAYVV